MNKIKPQYVSFEIAKLLKEKGLKLNFCREVFYINPNKRSEPIRIEMIHDWELIEDKEWYSAPEIWQVVEWLRLEHGIEIVVIPDSNSQSELILRKYTYSIFTPIKWANLHCQIGRDKGDNIIYFLKPQEAYLAAFDYVLKELI